MQNLSWFSGIVRAWPSGKASVFGTDIPGSNPGARAPYFLAMT